MRGWITARHRSCRQVLTDDRDELGGRALEVVVDDDVLELALLRELPPGELEALTDLAGALRRPLAQTALELVERRCLDEDRDASRHLVPDHERAVCLQLE